jgi:preprotein translocase subunit SecD
MRSRTNWPIGLTIGLVAFAVGSVGLFLVSPLIFPLPPDFARTGGYVFVYEVDVPAKQNAVRVIERVIDVLKERIDPQGNRGVVFQPLTDNRIEIRVAVQAEVRRQRHSYLEARRALIAAGIDETLLDQTLDLPAVVRGAPEGPGGSSRVDRERGWQHLAETYPDQAGRLETLAGAYAAYERVKGTLDDPRDVMRLLRGSGVLEFHIAVRGSDPQGVNLDYLRRELAERGPENVDSPNAKWFPINDLKQWYDNLNQLDALLADPIGYFASGGQDLVAAERNGQHYLLLYVIEPRSMTHEGGQVWTVARVFPTVDNFGRPAVGFQLDGPGGRFMNRISAPHVGEPMAIVLDGEVYSAPRINAAIGSNGIIQGNFSTAELSYLRRVLVAGSLEADISREPLSVEEVEAEPSRDTAGGSDR